ncbi:MAG: ParA family protein [Flavobacteriales bacterium]|nr:ParA family protein [Flavobacteriales bacterium]
MLNRSNVGVIFDKTKGQLESFITSFKDRDNAEDFIFQKGAQKYFSNIALAEILKREGFSFSETKIITVANQKGGCAKTSTILSQARNLSDLGCKVLVLDTDSQANATRALIGEKGTKSLFHVISKEMSVKDVIVNVRENLDLLPANAECARIDFLLSDPKNPYNPAQLIRNYVKDLGYDFVLIDTSPSFSSINIACIASSNRVICPVPLATWEIDGVEQVSKLVNGMNEQLGTNIKLDFLISKFSKMETTSYAEITKIQELDGNLLKTLIPDSVAFKKAQKTGLLENKGKAYKETLKLTREILEHNSRIQ